MATGQYDDELRGALFKNDKRGNDKAPDYTGPAQIRGEEFRMAAWLREGQKGKYMQIRFEPKQDGGNVQAPSQNVTAPVTSDEDIPF